MQNEDIVFVIKGKYAHNELKTCMQNEDIVFVIKGQCAHSTGFTL